MQNDHNTQTYANDSATSSSTRTGSAQSCSRPVPAGALTIKQKITAALEELTTLGMEANVPPGETATLFREAADRNDEIQPRAA